MTFNKRHIQSGNRSWNSSW